MKKTSRGRKPSALESKFLEMAEGVEMVLSSAVDEAELQCFRWRQVARRSKDLNELATAAHDSEQVRMRRLLSTRDQLRRLLAETTAERRQEERR